MSVNRTDVAAGIAAFPRSPEKLKIPSGPRAAPPQACDTAAEAMGCCVLEPAPDRATATQNPSNPPEMPARAKPQPASAVPNANMPRPPSRSERRLAGIWTGFAAGGLVELVPALDADDAVAMVEEASLAEIMTLCRFFCQICGV